MLSRSAWQRDKDNDLEYDCATLMLMYIESADQNGMAK